MREGQRTEFASTGAAKSLSMLPLVQTGLYREVVTEPEELRIGLISTVTRELETDCKHLRLRVRV